MSMSSGGRKRPNNRAVYRAVGAVLAVLLLAFGIYSVKLYQKKKDIEALGLVTESELWQTEEHGGIIEYKGMSYERNPSVKAILLIGVDSSGEMSEKVTGSGGQADAVILAAHDVARDHVKFLMIPRDTMTPIPMTDLSGHVIGKAEQHLTLAYGYGDGRELSCEFLSEAVSELLCGLSIDSYLAMNTSMMAELNDLVGGVTVRIETDDLEARDPALKKGETVTLQGDQAEVFVRYRDIAIDNSAITRMARQEQYMTAYFQVLKSQAAADDQTVPRLMDAVEEHMVTNMGKDQYMSMVLDIIGNQDGLSSEDILTLPGQAVTAELFDEYHHDPDGTTRTVLELFYREIH